MASGMYNNAINMVLDGSVSLTTSVLKVMLLDGSGYTFDPDHDFISSGAGTVGANEIPNVASYASGYGGAGRKTLGSKVTTINDSTNLVFFDAADVTWTALNDGVVGAAVIVYEYGGSDATSFLIAYIDNAAQFPITTNGGDITIQWHATGIITFSNA